VILYKYYGYESGVAALRNGKLGFRKPVNFNDPFELSVLSNSDIPDSETTPFQGRIDLLRNSVVILSLTRTSLNPLMWAHYGQEHTGFVVGYEVDDPFLMSKKYNIITVDQGDVVYINTKSPYFLNAEATEKLLHASWIGIGLNVDDLDELERYEVENLLRKILLTKHSIWVYEEEVRVVKVLQSAFNTAEEYQSDPNRGFSTITRDVAPSYCCSVIEGLYLYHKDAQIREVYLGMRNPLNSHNAHKYSDVDRDPSLAIKAAENNWLIKELIMENGSWGFQTVSVDVTQLNIPVKETGLLNHFSFSGKEAKLLKAKLSRASIDETDTFELTNWSGEPHLKKNGNFL
jgi:hypothetical protein